MYRTKFDQKGKNQINFPAFLKNIHVKFILSANCGASGKIYSTDAIANTCKEVIFFQGSVQLKLFRKKSLIQGRKLRHCKKWIRASLFLLFFLRKKHAKTKFIEKEKERDYLNEGWFRIVPSPILGQYKTSRGEEQLDLLNVIHWLSERSWLLWEVNPYYTSVQTCSLHWTTTFGYNFFLLLM